MLVACWRTTELGLHGIEKDGGAYDQMVRADVPCAVLLINSGSPRRIQIEWAELTGAVRRVRITRLGLAEAVLQSYRKVRCKVQAQVEIKLCFPAPFADMWWEVVAQGGGATLCLRRM